MSTEACMLCQSVPSSVSPSDPVSLPVNSSLTKLLHVTATTLPGTDAKEEKPEN